MNQELYLIDLDKLRDMYEKEVDNKYKQEIFNIIKERENLFQNGFSE